MHEKNRPIFIVSPLNRSGTNFLAKILTSTGAFAIPEDIGEDYLMVYSDKLESYFLETMKHWSKRYRENKSAQAEVLSLFGKCLEKYFLKRIPNHKRLLLKCPRPNNISNIFKFFPNAKVILIERESRDTITSFYSSFPEHSFYDAVNLFFKGSREVNDFYLENKSNSNVMKVIYEDLIVNKSLATEAIAEFCGITESEIDILNQPLIGTSELKKAEGKVHWKPIDKPIDFNPIGRYKNWTLLKKVIYYSLKAKHNWNFF